MSKNLVFDLLGKKINLEANWKFSANWYKKGFQNTVITVEYWFPEYSIKCNK